MERLKQKATEHLAGVATLKEAQGARGRKSELDARHVRDGIISMMVLKTRHRRHSHGRPLADPGL